MSGYRVRSAIRTAVRATQPNMLIAAALLAPPTPLATHLHVAVLKSCPAAANGTLTEEVLM